MHSPWRHESTGSDVEMAGPGVQINSTILNGGYGWRWNGTSMAAPHMAGVVANILEANPSLLPDDVKSIIERTGVKIDVEDDGTISIATASGEAADAAVNRIRGLTAEAEVGQTYMGVVTRIVDFGAFVEIFPGTDGLLHISEIADRRVKDVRTGVETSNVESVLDPPPGIEGVIAIPPDPVPTEQARAVAAFLRTLK